MRNAAYHLQAAFLGIELNNHQVNSFVIIHISRIVTQCGLMKTHHPNVVCPSLPIRVKPKNKQRGTENETFDEIHGQHHGAVMVKRMHGHRDQTLEWWALYFREKERRISTIVWMR